VQSQWRSEVERSAALGILVAATVLSSAVAAPKQGEVVPPVRVQRLDGAVFDTQSCARKITLIFYEDKDAAKVNLAFKNELGALRRNPGFKPNARIIAVADVSGHDHWPARGFVEDAIKAEERKSGEPIYLDWTGDFAKAIKAKKGASNIVLVGEDGKVILAHQGVVGDSVKDKVAAAMRKP
jgi:hypothetical protein